MNHKPRTEIIEVETSFFRLRADEEPDLVLPATRVTCPRCRARGWAAGQSLCSAWDAIEALKNACQGPEPGRYDYDVSPDVEPPDDLLPA